MKSSSPDFDDWQFMTYCLVLQVVGRELFFSINVAWGLLFLPLPLIIIYFIKLVSDGYGPGFEEKTVN